MTAERPIEEGIFPKDSGKSYALVELVPGEGPMVDKGPDKTRFSFPIVLLWELVLLLGVTLAIFLFSLLKLAPLGEIANPMVTTDPAKAPWYFVGLQELLEHMHPMVAGVIIPTILVVFLLAVPYIDHSREHIGIWFSTSRGRRITLLSAVYTLVVTPAYIALDNAFPMRELLRNSAPVWLVQGVAPAGILIVLVALPVLVLWRAGATRRELILALFTAIFVAALVFTITGFLFRGPGFNLYWPWQMPAGYNPWHEL